MRSRSFNIDEVTRILVNRNDPKTMDYYLVRVMNLKTRYADMYSNGHMNFTIASDDIIMSEAIHQMMRYRHYINGRQSKNKEQLFFVLEMFEDRVLPKCRTLRIIGRHRFSTQLPNPIAGQAVPPPPGPRSAFFYQRYEPPYIAKSKQLCIYCRNNWDRKGELKINDNNDELEQDDSEVNVGRDYKQD